MLIDMFHAEKGSIFKIALTQGQENFASISEQLCQILHN